MDGRTQHRVVLAAYAIDAQGRRQLLTTARCSTCPRRSGPVCVTTNLLERAFRVLRRRPQPTGALCDPQSANRILYGQMLRLNELLAGSRSRRPPVVFGCVRQH